MKEICIVSSDNKFEAVYYEPLKRPLNCVLVMPDYKTWSNDYFLINTGVEVSWKGYFKEKTSKVLKAVYKGSVIFEKRGVDNIQIVIDFLNKFNNITKNELELLLQDSQEKEKAALEISIEELKEEKATLEEQMRIYKEIQKKKEEIKDLLSKLE